MAFNINAHVILSGPKNIKAVTKSIQKQLGGLNTSINIQAPKNLTKQLGAFNKGINTLNKSIMNLQSSATSANASLKTLSNQFNNLNKSSAGMAKSQTGVQNALKTTGRNVHEVRNEIQAFGKDAALAIRRFSAFTVATGVVFGFVRAVQTATKSALDYERGITKVIQVTGAGASQIGKLKATIDDLSNSLGVDANELAGLARTFAQTGQSIEQVRASIRAVARSSLAPSFGEMKNTAEGLIAALAQFNIAAKDSEAVLSSINAVSKKFAVEAEDLISVVRRAGGVFSQAAGDFDDPKKSLNELIGIFTAVRSTTRESADTIAVGLRTIFTRIQRRGTIDFLRQFNIELVDARGNFIGLFPAFQELSRGLDKIIRKGDALTLSAITEELGGVRQVGKLIPAITQFNKALEATEVAGQAAARGLGKDVALALQPLGKQFELVQARFRTLIRDLAESKTFQNLAKVALSVANAFLSIADTLKPLLPIITTLATIKISKGIFEFGKGFVGGFSKGGGIGNVGETVGDVVTGGSGRKTDGRDTAVQQALSTALNNNTNSLRTASTALVSLNSSLSENRAVALRTSTQLLGGIGNLINALNRNAAVGSVRPKKFAKGGPVTGPSHAQGGVLAELEGGEYVIPKGYANGGKAIKITPDAIGAFFLRPPKGIDIDTAVKGQALITNQRVLERLNKGGGKGKEEERFIESIKNSTVDVQKRLFGKEAVAGGKLKDNSAIKAVLKNNPKEAEKARRLYRTGKNINIGDKGQKVPVKGDISGFFISARDIEKNADVAQSVTHHTTSAMESAIARAAADIRNLVGGIPPIDASEESLVKTSQKNLFAKGGGAIESIEGFIFEGIVAAITNATIAGKGASFDFSNFSKDSKDRLEALFGDRGILNLIKGDAKRSYDKTTLTSLTKPGSLGKKLIDDLNSGIIDDGSVSYLASGGTAFKPKGTDTVPAMLTPGEFVINKSSAEKIGYGNLGRMNHMAKGGVAAKGNVMQYFADGTPTPIQVTSAIGGLSRLDEATEKLIKQFELGTISITEYKDGMENLDKASERIVNVLDKAPKTGFGSVSESTMERAKSQVGDRRRLQTESILSMARRRIPHRASTAIEDKKEDEGREKSVEKMNKFVDGLGSATAAVGGMTAAIAGFDLENPMASLVSLGFAAQAASTALTAFGLGQSIDKLKRTLLDVKLPAWLAAPQHLRPGGVATRLSTPRDVMARETGRFRSLAFNARMSAQQLGTGKTAGMAAFATARAGGSSRLVASTKGLRVFARSLHNVPKLLKGAFTGLPGILTALLVGPLVNAVSGAISKGLIGRQESIRGIEDVKGIKGAGRAGGMAAGALAEAGGATAAVLTATAIAGMVAPPLAPFIVAIGLVTASLKLLAGAWIGGLAQLEFNAFSDLVSSVEGATKQLKRFNQLEIIGVASLSNLNESTEKTMERFGTAQDASYKRTRAEQLTSFTGMFGTKGRMSSALGGSKAADVGAAATGSGIATTVVTIGTAIVAFGLLEVATAGLITVVVGVAAAIGTLAWLLGSADQNIDALAISFDRASKAITPEFIEELDKAFEKSTKHLVENFAALDENIVKEMAAIQTIDPDLDPTKQANLSTTAFQKMGEALKKGTGETNRFVTELNRLSAVRIKTGVIKAVQTEADLLGEEGGKELKAAFVQIRGELDKNISEAITTGDMSKAFATIDEMDATNETKAALKEVVRARMEEDTAMKKQIATEKVIAMAARDARRALDALAAGLEQFGSRTEAIGNNAEKTAKKLQQEFEQITGERVIGELDSFNPFDNVSNATDQQIDTAISQLSSFGSTPEEGQAAFRDLAGLAKAERDFPLILRDVVNDLQAEAGPDGTVDNQKVFDTIVARMKEDDIELPPQALEALKATLQKGVTRQGEKEVFTMSALDEMLSETGDVNQLLGETSGKATEELRRATEALNKLKNAALETARIEQKIAKLKLDSQLAIMDKEDSIRDKVNKALMTTPDAFQQATGDLEKRLQALAQGGQDVKLGDLDVLDPAALQGRLQTLEERRAELKEQQGQIQEGQEPGSNALIDALKANAHEQQKVNSQLNGTKQALKELANDTRMLAAIESKIAQAQEREQTSRSGLVNLLDALNKLNKGEMSPEEFNQTITDPISALFRAFQQGQSITFDEGVGLLDSVQSNATHRAVFERLVDNAMALSPEEKRAQGLVDSEGNELSRAGVKRQMLRNLAENAGITGSAMAAEGGLPVLSDEVFDTLLEDYVGAQSDQEVLADSLQRIGNVQIAAMEAVKQHELQLLDQVLHSANEGFQKAAQQFQDAVGEFQAFRGGIDQTELQKFEKTVVTRDKDLKQAKTALEGEKKKLENMKKKGSKATPDEIQAQRRKVEDSKSAVRIKQEALSRAKDARDRAKLAHNTQKEELANKKRQNTQNQQQAASDARTSQDNKPAGTTKPKPPTGQPPRQPADTRTASEEQTDMASRKRRLEAADKFIADLKDKHGGDWARGKKRKVNQPGWWDRRRGVSTYMPKGDVDLNPENEKKYREILGEELFQEVKSRKQQAGSHSAARAAMLAEEKERAANTSPKEEEGPPHLPTEESKAPADTAKDEDAKKQTSIGQNGLGILGSIKDLVSKIVGCVCKEEPKPDTEKAAANTEQAASAAATAAGNAEAAASSAASAAASPPPPATVPLDEVPPEPTPTQETPSDPEPSPQQPPKRKPPTMSAGGIDYVVDPKTGRFVPKKTSSSLRGEGARVKEEMAERRRQNEEDLDAKKKAKQEEIKGRVRDLTQPAKGEGKTSGISVDDTSGLSEPQVEQRATAHERAFRLGQLEGVCFDELRPSPVTPIIEAPPQPEVHKGPRDDEDKPAPTQPHHYAAPRSTVVDKEGSPGFTPNPAPPKDIRSQLTAEDMESGKSTEQLVREKNAQLDHARGNAARAGATQPMIMLGPGDAGYEAAQRRNREKAGDTNREEKNRAGGNIQEMLENGAKSIGQILTNSLNDAAVSFATTVTDSEMWKAAGGNFAKKAREDLEATDIKINAQMGPITVTLSDNGMLRNLENNLVTKLTSIVQDAIQRELGLQADGTPSPINNK